MPFVVTFFSQGSPPIRAGNFTILHIYICYMQPGISQTGTSDTTSKLRLLVPMYSVDVIHYYSGLWCDARSVLGNLE